MILTLALNDLEGAEQKIASALSRVEMVPRATLAWRAVHFAAYEVFRAAGRPKSANYHLGLAVAALEEIAAGLAAAERRRLSASSRLNRQITKAVTAAVTQQRVLLARQGAGRGRPRREEEQCAVVWTLASPVDDTWGSPAERRRAVLQRLLREAEEQGGAPTHADLATALSVSRRTIIRDMSALQAEDDAAA